MRRCAIAFSLPVVALLLSVPVFADDSRDQSDNPSFQPTAPAPIQMITCTTDVSGILGSGSSNYPGTSGNQTGRLNRNGVASSCASPKSCLIFTSAGSRAYDAYSFTNTTNHVSCVSVTLVVNTQAACNLQVNAYLGSYNPASICTNYLADPGLSSGTPPTNTSMSFNLGAGQVVVLAVHTTNPGEIGCSYDLIVDGDICTPVPSLPASWGGIKAMYPTN